MGVAYSIYEERVTPESAEYGEAEGPPELVDSGVCRLVDIVRGAVSKYNIAPRASGDGTLWFCSDDPPADREYFEQGVEKYYALHIHNLTARSMSRINAMLRKVWKGA